MYLRSNMASFWVAMLDFRGVAIGRRQPAYYITRLSDYQSWRRTVLHIYKVGPYQL